MKIKFFEAWPSCRSIQVRSYYSRSLSIDHLLNINLIQKLSPYLRLYQDTYYSTNSVISFFYTRQSVDSTSTDVEWRGVPTRGNLVQWWHNHRPAALTLTVYKLPRRRKKPEGRSVHSTTEQITNLEQDEILIKRWNIMIILKMVIIYVTN